MKNTNSPLVDKRDHLQHRVNRALSLVDSVNQDVFDLTESLLLRWLNEKQAPGNRRKFPISSYFDPETNRLLKREKMTDEWVESIRSSIISFATLTNSPSLFYEVVRLLRHFRDASHVPILQGWLNLHVRKSVLADVTVRVLVEALEASGETIKGLEFYPNQENTLLDNARAYMVEKMKVIPV